MESYFDYQKAVFNSTLSTNARITALAVASHFNFANLNPVWPSRKRLASLTGLSVRSIDRAKDELVDKGWLTWKRRFDETNLYVPSIPESGHSDHPRDTQSLPETDDEGQECTPRDTQSLPMSHTVSRVEPHSLPNSPLNYPMNSKEEEDEARNEEPDLSLVKNVEEPGEVKELELTTDPFLVSSDVTLPEAGTGYARSIEQGREEEVVTTTHPSLVTNEETSSLVSNEEKAGELEDPLLVLEEVDPVDQEENLVVEDSSSSFVKEEGEDADDHEELDLGSLLNKKGLTGDIKDKVQRELEGSYDPAGSWDLFNDDTFQADIKEDHHARARWAVIKADTEWEKVNGRPAVEW